MRGRCGVLGAGVAVVTMSPAPEVRLSDDGRCVHLGRSLWTGSFPVEELGEWLRFYRGLRDRKGGKYAASYAPMVEALERVRDRLRMAGVNA